MIHKNMMSSKKAFCDEKALSRKKPPSSQMRQHPLRLPLILMTIICLMISILICDPGNAKAATKLPSVVVLSCYKKTMMIGDEFMLIAPNSKLVLPKFTSSSSSVASVNTYGKVTAKKTGSCKITAKISKAEASCRITVTKTEIDLSATSVKLENGASYQLTASTSNGREVTWSSSSKKIAEVNEKGLVTAKKPGIVTITAKCDGSKKTCRITVKKPTMKLNRTQLTLYRKQMFQLFAKTSSGLRPKYTSSRKSVVTVDEYGMVKAVKHGTATITAKLDGTEKTCEITVTSPTITVSPANLTLAAGKTAQIKATVSSGNKPTYKCSNTNIATVNNDGLVKGLAKGKTVVYISEDGSKECVHITVTE